MNATSRKIAIAVPSFSIGGLETSLLRMAGHLAKAGHCITIVTTEQPGKWFHRIEECGFRSHAISGLTLWNPLVHAFKVGEHLRNAGYDVLLVAFDRYTQAALGLLSDKTIVIPLLRNDHEDVYHLGLANARHWHVAIGNSPRICQTAHAKNPDKHVALIPNGVTCPDHVPGDRWMSTKRIEALFVGRLIHESKRVLLLPPILKACIAKGINLHLIVAGDGEDRAALTAEFERLGLTSRVTQLGYVPPAELTGLYQKSHLFFFLSAYEGLPNVLLECQAHGCIPITTRLEGITDYVVKDGVTGHVVNADAVNDFATAVATTCSNSVAAAAMSLESHKWIQENFSTSLESDRLLAVLADASVGKYPLPTTRRTHMIDLSLFPPRFFYRRLIKPVLARPYRAMRRLVGSLQTSAKTC